jgi:transcriptional regulator with XRE-family HTH domain
MQSTNAAAGKSIVRYLESKGIRQSWLARQLGVSPVALNRTLHASRGRGLSNDQLRHIALILEVPRAVEAEWIGLINAEKEGERP